MSVDLRLRHDRLLREQAVELFERGFGYRLTAKRLGVPAEAVRHWQKTYRVIGRDGFLAMEVKRTKYDYETKVAAARAVVDGGMSKPEAMVRFGIASATPLKNWCRLYREGGAQAREMSGTLEHRVAQRGKECAQRHPQQRQRQRRHRQIHAQQDELLWIAGFPGAFVSRRR